MDSSDDVMSSISLRQKLRGNEQIARESAEKYWTTPVSLKGQRQDLERVILAAIEKARYSEDLMYRYHNDVRFNRFVQERMAYALEAAQPQRSIYPDSSYEAERGIRLPASNIYEQPPATEQRREPKESGCTCGDAWPCPLHGGPPEQPQRSEHEHVFDSDGGTCHTCGLSMAQILAEQQPPVTEQEWTPEKIEHPTDGCRYVVRTQMGDFSAHCLKCAKAICNAHNAAMSEKVKGEKK